MYSRVQLLSSSTSNPINYIKSSSQIENFASTVHSSANVPSNSIPQNCFLRTSQRKDTTNIPTSHDGHTPHSPITTLDPQNQELPVRTPRSLPNVLVLPHCTMPRHVDTPPSPSDNFLCDRIQQFRQRMRSRCLEAHATSSDAPAIPCLLQSWRKRIEAMDDPDRKRGHCHFRKPGYTPSDSSTEESDESTASPPPCRFPFRGPRMHPKLERQQAVCSLSDIWSGFTSSSPPPSPEIYAKPRHRRHPYSRCGRDRDDHGESSTA